MAHEQAGKFLCGICTKKLQREITFKTRRGLNCHRTMIHGGVSTAGAKALRRGLERQARAREPFRKRAAEKMQEVAQFVRHSFTPGASVPIYIRHGDIQDAKRRALSLFDSWNRVAGIVSPSTATYYELQNIIEDAVTCGVQAGCGIYEQLPVEKAVERG